MTPKQKAALLAIAANPMKSGGFFRDLGHSPTTLAWLERNDYAEGVARDVFQYNGIRQQWRPTRKGKAEIEQR